MDSQKPINILQTLIKIGVVTVLIIAASTKQQYGFYNFVRWAVMIPSFYFTYVSFSKKQIGLVIYFLFTGIIFNPFSKFWFQKHTWHIVDYLTAGIFILSIIFDWMTFNNENNN